MACAPVSGAPSETVHLPAIPKSLIPLTNISWADTGCQAPHQMLRIQQELDRQVLSAPRELTCYWACRGHEPEPDKKWGGSMAWTPTQTWVVRVGFSKREV